MPKPHRPLREREFGVPIAGEILPAEQWCDTSLKALPGPDGWSATFGRSAPLVVDLGCGNGRFLLGSAVWRPECDHLGIDNLPLAIRYAVRRGNQRGLTNLRFAVADARRLLPGAFPSGGVAEFHCYHPQPYYDPALRGQRLLQPAFLAALHEALAPGGSFFVQTDQGAYWRYLLKVLPAFFDFAERHAPWPDAPKGRTRREILALKRGFPVYRGIGIAKPLAADERRAVAATLPPADFDADPALRELDDLEAE